MTIGRIVDAYERGELYEVQIENIGASLKDAEKRLKDELEEIEFYGSTEQRIANAATLSSIVSVLKYRIDNQNQVIQ